MVRSPTRQELDATKHLLHSVHHRIKRGMREILQDSELTFPQASILKTIDGYDTPPTLADVACKMHLAPSTVTDIVQRLERNELLVREKDPADARAFRLQVTTEARKLIQVAEARYDAFILHSIVDFDTDELQLFLSMLDRLNQALQSPMPAHTESDPSASD